MSRVVPLLTITAQLTAAFGPLSDDVQARINAATTEQLQTWDVRVRTATSLDDVLD